MFFLTNDEIECLESSVDVAENDGYNVSIEREAIRKIKEAAQQTVGWLVAQQGELKMEDLIKALKKIAETPCQCNCGNLHFKDCAQTIARDTLKAAQQVEANKIYPVTFEAKQALRPDLPFTWQCQGCGAVLWSNQNERCPRCG